MIRSKDINMASNIFGLKCFKNKFRESVVSDIHKTSNWKSFDKYFDGIQKEIIEPLETSTKAFMGYDTFVV